MAADLVAWEERRKVSMVKTRLYSPVERLGHLIDANVEGLEVSRSLLESPIQQEFPISLGAEYGRFDEFRDHASGLK